MPGFRTIFETVYEPGRCFPSIIRTEKEIDRYSLETAGAYERINIVREDTARKTVALFIWSLILPMRQAGR